MAVAIWDRLPTPAELLSDRVERGWQPTPTRMATGWEVLGVAASLPEAVWRTTP